MAILRVLWARGPSTVRQVHEVLQPERNVGYTTVLKMLQIMRGKGIVSREDARRPHIYAAAQERDIVQDGLVQALVRKAFGGSSASLVMRALSGRSPSSAELADIRDLLDAIEPGAEE
jgi:predicted transcriptional regulator